MPLRLLRRYRPTRRGWPWFDGDKEGWVRRISGALSRSGRRAPCASPGRAGGDSRARVRKRCGPKLTQSHPGPPWGAWTRSDTPDTLPRHSPSQCSPYHLLSSLACATMPPPRATGARRPVAPRRVARPTAARKPAPPRWEVEARAVVRARVEAMESICECVMGDDVRVGARGRDAEKRGNENATCPPTSTPLSHFPPATRPSPLRPRHHAPPHGDAPPHGGHPLRHARVRPPGAPVSVGFWMGRRRSSDRCSSSLSPPRFYTAHALSSAPTPRGSWRGIAHAPPGGVKWRQRALLTPFLSTLRHAALAAPPLLSPPSRPPPGTPARPHPPSKCPREICASPM